MIASSMHGLAPSCIAINSAFLDTAQLLESFFALVGVPLRMFDLFDLYSIYLITERKFYFMARTPQVIFALLPKATLKAKQVEQPVPRCVDTI